VVGTRDMKLKVIVLIVAGWDGGRGKKKGKGSLRISKPGRVGKGGATLLNYQRTVEKGEKYITREKLFKRGG